MTSPIEEVPVWDLVQRLLHGGLIVSIALAWWAGEERLSLHVWAGYAVLAIVSARLLWGLVGSRYARFARFVRSPRIAWRYLRAMLQGREPRYLGHNPLGAWMVLALLSCVLVACVSGIFYTTDHYWGLAWLERTHLIAAWSVAALVALHVAGVVFTGCRHRENLVAAMWTGRKRKSKR